MGTLKINNQEILTETAGVVSAGSSFPIGHIVQTVTKNVDNVTQSTSSQSFTEMTDYATSFTPKFSNSKIILTWSCNWYINADNGHGYFQFYRDVGGVLTPLGHSTEGNRLYQAGHDGKARWQSVTVVHVDIPSTTNTITYKIYIKSSSSSAGFRIVYGANYYSQFHMQELKV